jgi:hypothetical protein
MKRITEPRVLITEQIIYWIVTGQLGYINGEWRKDKAGPPVYYAAKAANPYDETQSKTLSMYKNAIEYAGELHTPQYKD